MAFPHDDSQQPDGGGRTLSMAHGSVACNAIMRLTGLSRQEQSLSY